MLVSGHPFSGKPLICSVKPKLRLFFYSQGSAGPISPHITHSVTSLTNRMKCLPRISTGKFPQFNICILRVDGLKPRVTSYSFRKSPNLLTGFLSDMTNVQQSLSGITAVHFFSPIWHQNRDMNVTYASSVQPLSSIHREQQLQNVLCFINGVCSKYIDSIT